MDAAEQQGWLADPFGQHELRYFSAGTPTKLVRDGRVESYEEPPSALLRPSAVVAAVGQIEPEPPEAAGGAAARPVARKRRRWITYGVVAVPAAAIVAVLAIMLGRPGTSGGGRMTAAEAAFIAASVQRTLAQGTAQFTLTGTTLMTGPTKKFRLSDTDHGTGAADLRTGSYSTTATAHFTSGEVVPGTDRLIGTTIYDQTGHLPWVRTPETAKGVRSIDPFADLPFFAAGRQRGHPRR